MSPYQQRIAIAEACGWRWNVKKDDGLWWVFRPEGGGAGMTTEISPEYFFSVFSVPDYLNSLDAAITLADWLWKEKDLACICDNVLGTWTVIFQRYDGVADELISFRRPSVKRFFTPSTSGNPPVRRSSPLKTMKTNIELQPFITPNYVLVKMPARPRQEGFQENPKFALSELEESTLSELCDKFREEIFLKAGKEDPRVGIIDPA